MANEASLVFTRIGSGLAAAETAVAHWFGEAEAVDKAIKTMTPQAKAAAVKIFTDLVAAVSDGAAAANAGAVNFTLDAQAYTDVRQLIADASAGVKGIREMFQALGLPMPKPAA